MTESRETTRTINQLHATVIQVTCAQCWAYPNRECVIFPEGPGPHPLHLQRYEAAYKKSLITTEELTLAGSLVGKGRFVNIPPAEPKKVREPGAGQAATPG